MKKKLRWLSAAIIILAVFISGCASKENEGSGSAANGANKYEGLTVTIGYQGSGGLFGKAVEEKWFEEEFEKRTANDGSDGIGST
jgi:sulfonate transport system substrate-binding protein